MQRITIVATLTGLAALAWAGNAGVAAEQEVPSVAHRTASADGSLAEQFPVTVDGRPVVVETWSGAGWVARLDPDDPIEAAAISAADSFAAATGATLHDIEVASAPVSLDEGGELTISAARAQGSNAYDFVDAAVGTLVPGARGPAAGWSWAGDRWISFHPREDGGDEGLVIAYPAADTVWTIDVSTERDDPAAEVVEPIIEALPPQPGPIGPAAPVLPQRVELPALGIAASFPEDWVVETVPIDDETQKVIDRSTARVGIEAGWIGTIGAVGPEDAGLGAAPMCQLMVFTQTDPSARAWVEAVTEYDRCYLVDETPTGLVRARLQPLDCGRDWAPSQGGVEHFALGRDGEIAYLNCWTKEPPGERGSAIAASIEFLPDPG